MRRHLSTYLTALALVLATASCTRNNGDIGPLFGTWRLDEILINGEPDEAYTRDVLWMFQSQVISMIEVDDATSDFYQSWGTWEREGQELLLDFRHSDGWNEPGSEMYSPLPQTHIAPNCVTSLHIERLDNSKMTLISEGADGVRYCYILTKYK